METLKKLNVLIVEDDSLISESFSQTFKYHFKKIYQAKNGIEALKIYKEEVIDIIFCDYLMPKMNGLELVENIRKLDKKIVITIITNHAEKDLLLKFIPLNLLGYIEKPVSYEKLKNYLEKKLAPEFKEKNTIFRFCSNSSYNSSSATLNINNKCFKLTKKEKELLDVLLKFSPQPAPVSVIEESLYPDRFELGSEVKNLVYRIRKKYSFNHIHNIREFGYSLKTNAN
jgi:DNA-binding response OmpR family regulator